MMVGGFLALAALTIGLFAWLKADISGLRQEIGGLREAFEAAGLYAEAHPLRGRPSGGPWRWPEASSPFSSDILAFLA